MPGVGILLRFFDPGARVVHRKAVPQSRNFDGKELVARQSVRGGGDGNRSN